MDKILTLFRGDNIDNDRTKPAIYRSEGIVSGAFAACGAPDMIERVQFLNSVKMHIDHIIEAEKDYYKISDYISFSESEEIAERWASRNQPEYLNRCNVPYMETRYVFRLKIPFSELIPIEKGVWEFKYACNPNLKFPYKLNEVDLEEPIAQTYALRFYGCAICGGVNKSHSLKVINPLLAFNSKIGDPEFNRSLRLAEKNLEWLILPNDIIDHGFRATRIQPAGCWGVKGYVMSGEEVRSPYSVPYKGY